MEFLQRFLTHDLVTMKETASISHSPHPPAAGRSHDAEIMESLLAITETLSILCLILNENKRFEAGPDG